MRASTGRLRGRGICLACNGGAVQHARSPPRRPERQLASPAPRPAAPADSLPRPCRASRLVVRAAARGALHSSTAPDRLHIAPYS